ncbi:MAG: XRE family transcriptional regulator [uncultured bacterium]|nr:MAG: XRE family transcriptional regulator [uncultured bacterium]
MKSYKTFKNQLLKDKEIKKAYNELDPEFELIQIIIEKRLKQGLTQKELAQKIGTKQSAISRLERGSYNPTVAFLRKLAKALDTKLRISFSART